MLIFRLNLHIGFEKKTLWSLEDFVPVELKFLLNRLKILEVEKESGKNSNSNYWYNQNSYILLKVRSINLFIAPEKMCKKEINKNQL